METDPMTIPNDINWPANKTKLWHVHIDRAGKIGLVTCVADNVMYPGEGKLVNSTEYSVKTKGGLIEAMIQALKQHEEASESSVE